MELTHNFTVAVPVERAWQVLLDLEQVAPCMPGATLTSHQDDEFTGTVRVKMGPVTMTFAGQGRFVERDAEQRRIVIEASGKDRKGGGTARATVRAGLRDQGGVTEVDVHTDMVVTGRAAQFGRGMIAEVSTRLLGQFTDCLATRLGASAAPGGPAAAPAAPGSPAAPDGTATAPAAGAGTAPATGGIAGAAPAETGAGPAEAGPVPVPGAEPIDLLAVTGMRAAVARAVPYLVIFVIGALVGAGLVVWLG
jgi:carbon monoxide dehydrogenase subunit G